MSKLADNVVYYVGTDSALAGALQCLLHNYDIAFACFTDSDSFLAKADSLDLDDCCVMIELESNLLQTLLENETPCPLIVLTDSPTPEDRRQLIAAGATDLIEKPLVSTYIYTRLAELVPGAGRMPSTPQSTMNTADGTQITLRMMHPEDAQIEQDFTIGLSDESRYLRFFSGIKKLPPYMLEQLTNPDFPISYALIATIVEDGAEKEIGVARYAPNDEDRNAEFAVVVADEWQGHGIASQLMRGVIAAAAVGGIERLIGIVLKENAAMLRLAESLGFHKTPSSGAGPSVVRVVKELKKTNPEAP